MTTVAWDGTTLAADTQASAGGTLLVANKIASVGDSLVGFSGNLADGNAFVEWLRAKYNSPTKQIPYPKMRNLRALVIDKDRSLQLYQDESEHPENHNLRMWVAGTGGDYALAAMKLGKSATEAVQLASELDIDTGVAIQSLTFERLTIEVTKIIPDKYPLYKF